MLGTSCFMESDPTETITLSRGDRIAQLVVQQVARARFVQAERLPGSARGEGGFGSSGGWSRSPVAEN